MIQLIQFVCLQLVCKSCLVKHLEENNTCPTCEIVIHQSHPLQYISFDRTMQDIVYKLVPNLQQSKLFLSDIHLFLCYLIKINYFEMILLKNHKIAIE